MDAPGRRRVLDLADHAEGRLSDETVEVTTTWEYRWESVDYKRAADIGLLNNLGQDGWEVAAMAPVPRSDNQMVLLKRATVKG